MLDLLLYYESYQFVSFALLLIAVSGIIFNYRNVIITLISIELALLSINFFLVISSLWISDLMGLIFSLIILTVAAAEAAIGLALLILFYRGRTNILIKNNYYLRG